MLNKTLCGPKFCNSQLKCNRPNEGKKRTKKYFVITFLTLIARRVKNVMKIWKKFILFFVSDIGKIKLDISFTYFAVDEKKWFPAIIALLEVDFQRVMIIRLLSMFFILPMFFLLSKKWIFVSFMKKKFSKKRKIFMINLIKENRFIIPENWSRKLNYYFLLTQKRSEWKRKWENFRNLSHQKMRFHFYNLNIIKMSRETQKLENLMTWNFVSG